MERLHRKYANINVNKPLKIANVINNLKRLNIPKKIVNNLTKKIKLKKIDIIIIVIILHLLKFLIKILIKRSKL